MSTPQGEAQPVQPTSRPSGAGGNAFTRKLGPLPVWAWMAVGLAIALGYYFWRQNSGKGGSSINASTTTPPDQTTAASQIPQFVNQTFVQGEPPTPVGTQPPNLTAPGGGAGGISTYRTNGKMSLKDIAKHLGVTEQVLIADTLDHPGNVNGGKFEKWLKTSKMGATGKVPANLDLFYTTGQK